MARNAPGKHYRKGITLPQLFDMFPNDAAAEEWFAEHRWPDGPRCPHCGSDNIQSPTRHPEMRHRCRSCPGRPFFSTKTGTILEGSKLGYRVWAIALYLLMINLKGVSSMRLHRDLGITQKTAWYLMHRLRKAFQTDQDLFTGPVEVDETYIGGKEKNKHASKRLKAGRGTVGKTAVVGVKDRATNQIAAEVVSETSAPMLQGFIFDHVDPEAMVYTDNHRSYLNLPFKHETVDHSVSQYVSGMAHTNGLESFWATLKRGYHGTFHHMSSKHLHRYIDEFAGRHNLRPRDTEEMMAAVYKGLIGKRLFYDDLVAD